MKSIIIIISMSLVYSTSVCGQKRKEKSTDAQKVISYNFQTGKFDPRIKTVKVNDQVTFRVTGVNRYLYDVKIEEERESFHMESGSLFKQFIIDAVSSTDDDEESLDTAAPDDMALVGDTPAEQFSTLRRRLKTALDQLIKAKGLHQGLYTLLRSTEISCENVTRARDQVVNKYYPEMSLCSLACDAQLKSIVEDDLEEAIKALAEMKKFLEANKSDVTIFDSAFYNSIVAQETKIKEYDFENLIKEIFYAYQNLNPNLFVAESSELINVERTDDLITFKAQITPREEFKSLEQKGPKEVKEKLYVEGWKIDFSSGIFFLTNDLKNEEYELKSVFGTTAYNIVQVNSSDWDINVGALAHISYRFGTFLASGGHFGVSVNSDQNVRYLLGPSFIIGRKQRIIFNGSIAYGKVKKLSPTLSTEETISDASDLKLTEGNSFGFALGISYNF